MWAQHGDTSVNMTINLPHVTYVPTWPIFLCWPTWLYLQAPTWPNRLLLTFTYLMWPMHLHDCIFKHLHGFIVVIPYIFSTLNSFYSAPISYLKGGTGQKRRSTWIHVFLLFIFLHFRGGIDQNDIVAWTRHTTSTLYQFHILEEEQANIGVVHAYMFSTLHFFFYILEKA